ncbi:hypothetical protein GGX14DRAFT_388275 [Mycena pura]|uniref:Uncharacterized protein n=1 Tax=Mycena pura TaxID=153505 RepID=A0AAD7E0A1_9AGAR|nr:hypothetical protein GGX14DRAFT_388275 [Mycena pura]
MVPYLQRDVYEARVTPTNIFLSPLIFALLLPQPAPPTTPTFPITPGGAPIVVCVCGVHDTDQHSQPPFPAPHMGDAFGVGPPYTALKEHAWYGFAAYPRPRSDATDSGSNSASPSECRDASASADGGSDYTYSAARLELGTGARYLSARRIASAPQMCSDALLLDAAAPGRPHSECHLTLLHHSLATDIPHPSYIYIDYPWNVRIPSPHLVACRGVVSVLSVTPTPIYPRRRRYLRDVPV